MSTSGQINEERPALCFVRQEPYQKLQRAVTRDRLEPKRIFNVHGPAGFGKSSLLESFRRFCKQKDIPVALVSGNRKLTEIEFMRELAAGLEEFKVKMPSFHAELRNLNEQQQGSPKDDLVKDGTEVAGGVAKTVAPLVPYGSLIKPAFDVAGFFYRLLERRKRHSPPGSGTEVTAIFVKEITRRSKSRRLVLVLDQYEEMTNLDNWLCDWLRLMPPTVFVVVAGQPQLGGVTWYRRWPDWMRSVEDELLEPLSEKERRDFVILQYRSLHGRDADPAVVDEILASGAASPLILLVEVWLRRLGLNGQASPGPGRITDDIVEFLLHGAPQRERSIVEAAATVRFFDEELLRNLTGAGQDAEPILDLSPLRQLRVWNNDGWTLPGSVREVVRKYLHAHKQQRSDELHRRACEYYKQRVGQLEDRQLSTQEELRERRKWELEHLYHQFQLSPSQWITDFRRVFETAFRRYELQYCRSLVSDASAYASDKDHGAWLSFYQALVAIHLGRMEEGRRILEQLYERILGTPLMIRVLESFASLCALQDRRGEAAALCESYLALCQSHSDLPGQAGALIALGNLNKRTGRANEYLVRAQVICSQLGEEYPHLAALVDKDLADSYRLQGRFQEATELIVKSIKRYEELDMKFELAHAIRTHAMLMVFIGKLREAEDLFRKTIRLFNLVAPEGLRMYERVWPLIGLGDVAMGERRFIEAQQLFDEALEVCAGSEFETAVIQGCLADLHCAQENWDRAMNLAELSLGLRRKHEDDFGIGWVMTIKGQILLRKGKTEEARGCFDEGLASLRDGASFFVRSKLILGKTEVYFETRDADAFRKAANEVRQYGELYGYWDHLALLHFLEGAWALRGMESGAGPEGVPPARDVAAHHFVEARKCALRYNIFQFDLIVPRITSELERMQPKDRAWVESVMNNKLKDAMINGETLGEIERHDRAKYAIDHTLRTIA